MIVGFTAHFVFSLMITWSKVRGEGGKNPECVCGWLGFSSLNVLSWGAICIELLRWFYCRGYLVLDVLREKPGRLLALGSILNWLGLLLLPR